jgi:hypothetical protein
MGFNSGLKGLKRKTSIFSQSFSWFCEEGTVSLIPLAEIELYS